MNAAERRVNRVKTVISNIRAVNGCDVTISAKANSPIAKILGASSILPRTDATNDEHNALSYIVATPGDEYGISYNDAQHELAMELANQITDLLTVYRGEINSATKDIVEDYNNQVNVEAVSTVGTGDMVAVNAYQGIWNSVQISNLAEKYTDVQPIVSTVFDTMGKSDVFPRLGTFDEVVDLIKTGITNLDKQIVEHLNIVLPDDELVTHYNKTFFHNEFKIGERLQSRHVTVTGVNRNQILVNYLVAKYALSNWPDDQVINLKPIDLRYMMNELEKLCGASLSSVFTVRKSNIDRGILIYKVDKYTPDSAEIPFYTYHVNEQPYRKFIADGGNDDAITSGAFTAGTTVDNVLMHLDKAIKRHKARQTMIVERNSDAACVNSRITLYEATAKHYKENSQYYKDSDILNLYDEHMTEIRRRINQLTAVDFEFVEYRIRKIISNVLYPNTGAADFFVHMENAEILNPEGTARDYAAMAIIEHACQWGSNQLQVK